MRETVPVLPRRPSLTSPRCYQTGYQTDSPRPSPAHRGRFQPAFGWRICSCPHGSVRSGASRPETTRDLQGNGGRGVQPGGDGVGPVPAVRTLLERHSLDIDDIGLWQLNEAFASQALSAATSSASIPTSSTSTEVRSPVGHPTACRVHEWSGTRSWRDVAGGAARRHHHVCRRRYGSSGAVRGCAMTDQGRRSVSSANEIGRAVGEHLGVILDDQHPAAHR